MKVAKTINALRTFSRGCQELGEEVGIECIAGQILDHLGIYLEWTLEEIDGCKTQAGKVNCLIALGNHGLSWMKQKQYEADKQRGYYI